MSDCYAMRAQPKHNFSHIHSVKKSLRSVLWDIEESKRFIRRKRYIVVGSFAIFLVTGIILFSHNVKADVAVLYPESCLGGWSHPNHAQGKPNVDDRQNDADFNEENSSHITTNTAADIFCGSFVGDLPVKDATAPKKIILKLSWATQHSYSEAQNIVSDNFASSTQDILDASTTPNFTYGTSTDDTESEDVPGSNSETIESSHKDISSEEPVKEQNITSPEQEESKEVIPTITEPVQEEAPQQTQQPSTVETPREEAPQSLLKLLSPFAYLGVLPVYAEETPEEVSQENSNVEVSPIEHATSTENITPANTLVELEYSLDGTVWTSLGSVDRSHMTYAAFEIPLPEHFSWDMVSKIQIKVKSVVQMDDVSTIFLDGMQLEVAWDDVAPFEAKSGLYISAADSLSTAIDFQVRNNEEIQEVVITSKKEGFTGIAVFDQVSGELKLNTSVNGSQYVLQPEYFGNGIYVVISTDDPSMCTERTLAECRSAQDYKGEGVFEVSDSDNFIKPETENTVFSTTTEN